jgi:hypothetical protein
MKTITKAEMREAFLKWIDSVPDGAEIRMTASVDKIETDPIGGFRNFAADRANQNILIQVGRGAGPLRDFLGAEPIVITA